MIKIFSYLLQSIVIYFFFIIGRLLGIKKSRKLFSLVFSKAAPFFKSKKIIEQNLKIFDQNISIIKRDQIIKDMWENYGKTFIEYVYLNKFRENKSQITISGEKNLQKIIKDNKPVIFISGHFANFELMSMEITKNKIPLATIYRPLNNFFLNPFMEFVRRKYVCENQIKKGINGVREAIEFIKKNYSIALMIDQRVSEGEKIKFFNKMASTTTLPAQLALKYNLSIIPVFIKRDDNNNFKIEFYNEIKSSEYDNKIKLTEKLNNVLESMIAKNPNQWIWTHNRWK